DPVRLASLAERHLFHRVLLFIQRGGLPRMTARLPAVHPVPFLLLAEPDLPQPLFTEPVSVREVAALPERLFRFLRGPRHSFLPSRHFTPGFQVQRIRVKNRSRVKYRPTP